MLAQKALDYYLPRQFEIGSPAVRPQIPTIIPLVMNALSQYLLFDKVKIQSIRRIIEFTDGRRLGSDTYSKEP